MRGANLECCIITYVTRLHSTGSDKHHGLHAFAFKRNAYVDTTDAVETRCSCHAASEMHNLANGCASTASLRCDGGGVRREVGCGGADKSSTVLWFAAGSFGVGVLHGYASYVVVIRRTVFHRRRAEGLVRPDDLPAVQKLRTRSRVMVNWVYYGNVCSNKKKLEPINSEVALQPTDPLHPVKLGAHF